MTVLGWFLGAGSDWEVGCYWVSYVYMPVREEGKLDGQEEEVGSRDDGSPGLC